jgi:chaperonin cofactor prefoldin
VDFSEQPPSTQWAALTFRGERIAEVWFKPEGDPWAVVFRIPRTSFQIPGIGQRLTPENLLKAIAIATDEVESWRHGGVANSAREEPSPELTKSLPEPPHDVTHLELHVRLKPPAQATAPEVGREPEVSAEWHDLEARWKAVLGLEAAVETLRKNMESLRAELEASMRRALTADDKVNALAADVAQWNKAKSRAHYALPKANEFIHRATWAAGTPERKRLGELFKNPIETQASLPRAEDVLQELEFLRKDRQVLSAQGVTVYQECKAISADVQGALRRLQSNAAARASLKKGGTGARGKSF